MTKEAKSAKPLRLTAAEWNEVDKARARTGESRQAFMARATLGLARGELTENAKRAQVRDVAGKVRAVTPQGPARVQHSSDVERRPAFDPRQAKGKGK